MRVGVNCAILGRGASGSANATKSVVQALQGMYEVSELFPPKQIRANKLLNAVSSIAWDFYRAGHSTDLDILFSPCNTGRAPKGVGHIVMCYDTMVLDRPALFDRAYSLYARMTFGPSLRSADRVLVPSRHTEGQLKVRWPDIDDVTLLPLTTNVVPLPEPRKGLPSGFTVLMLGATEPHKRHELGIEAVRLLRLLGVPASLRIVGPARRSEDAISALSSIIDPCGEWITRVYGATSEEIIAELDRAWMLLQTSIDEGFCLPILEAAARGLPAVYPPRGSMPEVGASMPIGEDPWLLAAALAKQTNTASYAHSSSIALEKYAEFSPAQFRVRLLDIVSKFECR
jgi:glycosyltransferase involved in cell wall biosynthesis